MKRRWTRAVDLIERLTDAQRTELEEWLREKECRWLVRETPGADEVSCINLAVFDMIGVEGSIGECCSRCKVRMEKKMPKIIFERLS